LINYDSFASFTATNTGLNILITTVASLFLNVACVIRVKITSASLPTTQHGQIIKKEGLLIL